MAIKYYPKERHVIELLAKTTEATGRVSMIRLLLLPAKWQNEGELTVNELPQCSSDRINFIGALPTIKSRQEPPIHIQRNPRRITRRITRQIQHRPRHFTRIRHAFQWNLCQCRVQNRLVLHQRRRKLGVGQPRQQGIATESRTAHIPWRTLWSC